jgi:hypothetical protein
MDVSQTLILQQTALSSVKQAKGDSLSNWIFERVRPFVAGKILEIQPEHESHAIICMQLGITAEVLAINLSDAAFETNYTGLLGMYDTVIALHEGERMVMNRGMVTHCAKLLKQGGHFITMLPARTALYNGLDQGLKHWKIRNKEFINTLLRKDFSIRKTRYCITSKDPPTTMQRVSKYSERVTIFSEAEARGYNQMGLAIIVTGRKR